MLQALLTCNEVHTVAALTCNVVADLIGEAIKGAGEVCGLLECDAQLTPPPPTSWSMLVFVTASRSVILVTTVTMGKFLEAGPDKVTSQTA